MTTGTTPEPAGPTGTTGPVGLAPDLAALLAGLAASGTPPIAESTPQEARAGFRVLCVDLRPPEAAVSGVTTEDTTVAGRPARVYRPLDATGTRPTVLFWHGGGFVIGDLDTHDPLCRLLARDADAVVVAVDYPLAPEHPFPEASDHAVAALHDVHARLADLGGNHALAVAGDSAGGNLAAYAAQAGRDLDLAAQLLLYPKTDAVEAYPSMSENGTGYFLDAPTIGWFTEQLLSSVTDVAPDDPRISPLRGVLTGLAPAVVVTAGFDPLRDEGEAYAAALQDAGVAVDAVRCADQIHGFANMDHVAASSRDALTDVVRRFAAVLRSAGG